MAASDFLQPHFVFWLWLRLFRYKFVAASAVTVTARTHAAGVHTPPGAGDHQRVVFRISDCEAGSDLLCYDMPCEEKLFCTAIKVGPIHH